MFRFIPLISSTQILLNRFIIHHYLNFLLSIQDFSYIIYHWAILAHFYTPL